MQWGYARCRGCSCAQAKVASPVCSDCYPGRRGKCMNVFTSLSKPLSLTPSEIIYRYYPGADAGFWRGGGPI